MKFCLLIIVLLVPAAFNAYGQYSEAQNPDSVINQATHDTSGVNYLVVTAVKVTFNNANSGRIIAEKALDLAQELNYKRGQAEALMVLSMSFQFLGDYPQSIRSALDAIAINKEMKDPFSEITNLSSVGLVYLNLGQYTQAWQYLKSALEIDKDINGTYTSGFALSIFGDAYNYLNKPDSAFYFYKMAYEKMNRYHKEGIHSPGFILQHLGDGYAQKKEYDSALKYYNESILFSNRIGDKLNTSTTQVKIADIFENKQQYDSAFFYSRQAMENAQALQGKREMMEAGNSLAGLFRKKQKIDSVLFYLEIANEMKDSLYGPDKLNRMQLLVLQEQQNQTKLEQKQEQYRNRIRYAALISGLGVFLLLVFILLRNNQRKRKSNELLQKEKRNVEKAYSELKSAQQQLIQSEKMASLGELTAGIAHEIQNPLNFVNNFSEVNKELLEELKTERSKPEEERDDHLQNDLIRNVMDNSEKINYHGQRASSIIKGMLQHSRKSTGQKVLTDINALCDEYLRLAYHGLRAKDKSFNVKYETEFDPAIGKISLVPQDIGRVILNLINNAFYAALLPAEENFRDAERKRDPTVWVSTKREGDKILITIRDNGPGIPDAIKDKIFQPFFTTKPAGQGTGLGLSLSYDIVKVHGGEIKVKSLSGGKTGTEFIIQLPVA
ncbi:MAG: tetratricopeptide repeat protein [Chitinophagaceae bacterium]|nr:tetratricopeptide repeat protein [Chitinophagaceae bacterium]